MSTENPYQSPGAEVDYVADERGPGILESTWARTMPVWWSFYWRATLLGAVGGALLGGALGVLLASIGRPDLTPVGGAIAGYLIGVPVSMWCMKTVLGKSYRGFAVRLVKLENATAAGD